jgi:endonuclease YncB( thermonuclease family)
MMTRTMTRLMVAFGFFSSSALATVITVPAPVIHPADQNPQPASVECAHSDSALRCVKYNGNHDGDTVTVSIPDVHPLLGRRISVRLFGIDTPEMYSTDQCERDAALRAQRLVRDVLLRAVRVDLENVQRDKYFRILADIRADGASVSGILLESRLAYPYFGGTKQRMNWCTGRPYGAEE